MLPLYKKELRYLFSSPTAYLAIGVFWITTGLFLWIIPGEWNIIQTGYANVDGMFEILPWLLIMLCPALTMHLFVEERNTGNWDILLTKSLTINNIVCQKFFAVWTILLIAILPLSFHFAIVANLAEPIGNVDYAQFIGSLFGSVLLSGTMIALCLLTASVAKNQIVAFITGAITCFVFQWTVLYRFFASIARGVIDMQDIVFFLSVITLCVLLTSGILNSNR